MKELTIEQKAKAYDKKLAEAKEMLKDGGISQNTIDYIQKLYPELVESEDKRIRKALISFLKSPFVNESITDEKVTPWIAWLEKQGEHTSVTDLRTWKYIADYVVTKWCGIGQYLDSPRLTTIAEELQKKYSLKQKQGEQKLAEWSEADKRNINELLYLVEAKYLNSDEPHDRLINFLESLKERVQPQPKQEWSKENDKMLKHIIRDLKEFRDCETDEELISDYDDEIGWLKSLRPQSTWKPSDEQMKALSIATCGVDDPLFSLYQDLKKLKE